MSFPKGLFLVAAVYLLFGMAFASTSLDTDEINDLVQPYEMIGGDFTVGYAREGDYGAALMTAAKSYYYYWQYRPLSWPVVEPRHEAMFAAEREKFGYVKPTRVDLAGSDASDNLKKRVIVPEPERKSAGKPLLTKVLLVPPLAIGSLFVSPREMIGIQFTTNYHPIFILVRSVNLLAGLACIFVVFAVLRQYLDEKKAFWGAAVFAFFPTTIKYFPNLHEDSIMVLFLLLSVLCLVKKRYLLFGICAGLTLASKNTAVFAIPALTVVAALHLWQIRQERGRDAFGAEFGRVLRIGVTGGLAALICLAMFANPVSYAEELLTPVSGRELNEWVRKDFVTLESRLSAGEPEEEAGRSAPRLPLLLVQNLFYLKGIGFFFMVLMLAMALRRKLTSVGAGSLTMLMLAVPYGVLFRHTLSWRSLMFTPFFAMFCAEVATTRFLKGLVALLLFVDLFYVADPIRSDTIHYPADERTLIDMLLGELPEPRGAGEESGRVDDALDRGAEPAPR